MFRLPTHPTTDLHGVNLILLPININTYYPEINAKRPAFSPARGAHFCPGCVGKSSATQRDSLRTMRGAAARRSPPPRRRGGLIVSRLALRVREAHRGAPACAWCNGGAT